MMQLQSDAQEFPMFFRAQAGQDRYVYQRFFRERTKPGTFVEFGARDGSEHSNTFFFENALKWRGILVEPLEAEFRTLVQPYPQHAQGFRILAHLCWQPD